MGLRLLPLVLLMISNIQTGQTKERPKAKVTMWPDQHVYIGETVILRCDIQGGGDTEWTYSWTVENTNNSYRNTVNQCKTQECKINSVEHTHSGKYTCSGKARDGQNPKISDAVTLTVLNWKAVLSVSPQKWVTEGDSVTLICEVKDSSTDWTFSWYKEDNTLNYKLLSDSSRGAGGNYTLSSAAVNHTGVYKCSAERAEPAYYTDHSNTQLIWVTGVSPSVSLIISPNRTQHFSQDSLSLSCEDQSNSTGWTVRIYTDILGLHTCSLLFWASQTGSTCRISPVYTSGTGVYWCQSQSGEKSNPVNITVHYWKAVLSVSPQKWVTEGDSVTLICEVKDSSTDWTFSWYKEDNTLNYKLLSDSSRGAGGNYTLSSAAVNHTGVYKCRAEREEGPGNKTYTSNMQLLLVTGVSPSVSLIISPNRTQHFSQDSLSLSCEDQSNSTGWTVRTYTDIWGLQPCKSSQTGSTCRISPIYTSDTGVYWCLSESGEKRNPVNITVHNGRVILESPVHPVTEGDSLTLRCLHRYSNPSDLTADFYKDGSLLQKQTTGEMIIHTVSKSHEGFYYCKHTERGESPKSWISVRASPVSRSLSHGLITGMTVGLSVMVLFFFTLILLWCLKNNKGRGSWSPSAVNQQNISQMSEQKRHEVTALMLLQSGMS
ncbi:B-cell receptor CD22-like isoform X2 [Myxocyprinus asiaticus]|uniref:B-cell receptor CD22-like isoform X2 n=1 Tax=Myxocyprinus asiaticus TaxID=70543 RepID=UPI002223B651|nr:B-cell receptor CD22-like isoform X2 [Myxocyprinus asiaticus]